MDLSKDFVSRANEAIQQLVKSQQIPSGRDTVVMLLVPKGYRPDKQEIERIHLENAKAEVLGPEVEAILRSAAGVGADVVRITGKLTD